MIAYSICKSKPATPSSKIARLGFSVWAKNSPKDYLSIYPKAAEEVRKTTQADTVCLCALVDDVWPMISLPRERQEQQEISNQFVTLLPNIGFHETYLVSDFIEDISLENCLPHAERTTWAEFWKLLPQSKKNIPENLTFVEVLEFLWQIYILEIALNKFQLTGFLAGIRSEFFYLAARKLLPPHDVHFVNTS
jgi:hypothetical protein